MSYRTLDVEQIGSVYETVMGFTVEVAESRVLAIKAGKNNRTPVFVALDELLKRKGKDRIKDLKENVGRSLTAAQAKPVEAAATVEDLAAALDAIVDERGSPRHVVASPGTPILQPTDERRRTGSHYTPRSLTQPIVQHALEPAFERLGRDATPEQILDLKVCDPAMGSGAFLVEACRAIATRLVKAWERWPENRPVIPPDEDEELHARRLVAQRCLYGVDKNPRAVDLAKLSLWLATLAKDHEFTFLDHALKCGDSLVGLTPEQIAAANWDSSKPGLPLLRPLVAERVAEADRARAEIRSAPDDTMRAIQEQRHKHVEARLSPVRLLGDAVIAAFFSADKAKAREKARADAESWFSGRPARWDLLEASARALRNEESGVAPFHWGVEFPEVFKRENGGFDTIVGNPPFLGGKRISNQLGDGYRDWLATAQSETNSSADLVSHFFVKAYQILREGGAFGLVATNTIAQGDTREAGLHQLLLNNASIYRATKRLAWPGEAGVVVSVVHIKRGPSHKATLDGREVRRISAYLVEGDYDDQPEILAENRKLAFQGSIALGMGFTFDDTASQKGTAESIDRMYELIQADPTNAERIFPYLGGEEVTNDPRHLHDRFIIDLADIPLDTASAKWPDLVKIAEERVRPERQKQKRADLRDRWWQFAYRKNSLYKAISGRDFVFGVNCGASPHLAIAKLPARTVFANSLVIFSFDEIGFLSVVQSRIHEVWARSFSSSMKDDLRYTTTDCFETFPFPQEFKTSSALESVGQAYLDHRASLMVCRNEGMTKTYNRFHDRGETAADIVRLRELHTEMDQAVLQAYGWHDLANRAEPIFLDESNEDDHTYQGRLFWPADFRDEVLSRLLALNAERAAEERAAGLVASDEADEDQDDDGDDE